MMSKMTNRAIVGLGHDLIEIERIEESFERYQSRLLNRILTPKERALCKKHNNPIPYIAGRFSAKEAIAKALGTGIGKHLSWQDIEILNDPQGKPEVLFSKKAEQFFSSPQILLSISHSRFYASSVAILFRN